MVRDGGPIQAPKQVEPRHKNGGLVVAYVGDRERLANAVGFRNCVSIHDGDLDAARVAPRGERLVEVGEVQQEGAAGASGANDQHAHAVAQQVVLDRMINLHGVSQ